VNEDDDDLNEPRKVRRQIQWISLLQLDMHGEGGERRKSKSKAQVGSPSDVGNICNREFRINYSRTETSAFDTLVQLPASFTLVARWISRSGKVGWSGTPESDFKCMHQTLIRFHLLVGLHLAELICYFRSNICKRSFEAKSSAKLRTRASSSCLPFTLMSYFRSASSLSFLVLFSVFELASICLARSTSCSVLVRNSTDIAKAFLYRLILSA
jgi:hypothetical protein